MGPERSKLGPLNLVLADDHQMFLEGLVRLLATQPDLRIAGQCNDGDDLMSLVRSLKPDLAIVDVSMPGLGPAAIVDQIAQEGLPTRVLALTMHLEPALAHDLLSSGVQGYVIKEAAFEELLSAIEVVSSGDTYLSRMLVEAQGATDVLTDRERECLSAAASGQTAKMTALALSITERTVRFHCANACRKLGVQRLTEAVVEGLRRNLITPKGR